MITRIAVTIRRSAKWARCPQLVVVGSHGRGGFPRMLLGSVSSALAQSAKAALIIHRAR
jgi:nucleotide-binding universal stress UspA family protein